MNYCMIAICALGLPLAAAASAAASAAATIATPTTHPITQFVEISPDHRGFVLKPTGSKFIPFGFNYDRDSAGPLLEDYWISEWPRVAEDFREMKRLGANVVHVHLQYARFMNSPDAPNDALIHPHAFDVV